MDATDKFEFKMKSPFSSGILVSIPLSISLIIRADFQPTTTIYLCTALS